MIVGEDPIVSPAPERPEDFFERIFISETQHTFQYNTFFFPIKVFSIDGDCTSHCLISIKITIYCKPIAFIINLSCKNIGTSNYET